MRPLGQATAHGFAMLLGQGLISKAVSLGAQIVLARYLLEPEDFGVYSLALSVFTFTSATLNAGMTEVLVHRHSSFRVWANAAFWMTLALGLVAALATLVAAPIAARGYDSGQLASLLVILAISAIPTALAQVPAARLTAELRFTALAATGGMQVIAAAVIGIALAAIEPGPAALAWGKTIAAGLYLATLWWMAPVPIRRRSVQLRRWRYLVADNSYLFASKVALLVVSQGDYMILGLLTTEHDVGLYFFAFTLSMQSMALITGNIASVLFPALAKLQQDPRTQMKRFLRATELLAIVGVPACLAQAAVSRPVVMLLFDAKWHAAIPLLQLLSIGMAFRMIGSPGGSLLMAQGRFRALLVLCLSYAAVFAAAVATGGTLHGALGVAVAAAVFFTIQGPVNLLVAIAPNGGTLRDIWKVYAVPLAAGVVSVGVAATIMDRLTTTSTPTALIVQIVGIGLVSALVYVVMIRLMAPAHLRELIERVSPLMGRRVSGFAMRVAPRSRP